MQIRIFFFCGGCENEWDVEEVPEACVQKPAVSCREDKSFRYKDVFLCTYFKKKKKRKGKNK